jgi:Zn-dependent metalloprotease
MEVAIMKNPIILGLSSLGLAFSMQVNAMDVINLAKEASTDLNISGSSLKSLFTGAKDNRTITFKNEKFDLKVVSEKTDNAGKVHTRFVQTYNGIPVYGRQILNHKAARGMGFFANTASSNKITGNLVTDLSLDLVGVQAATGFTEQTALQHAKFLFNQSKNIKNPTDLVYENEQTELVIYTHDKNNKAKLAYKVSFFVDDVNGTMPARPHYLIDATTKETIKDWNGLMHDRVATGAGGNEKVGKYIYGSDMPKLDVRETQRGECFMTNKKVRTVDLKNGYWGAKTHHFGCYENAGDEVNGAYSPLNDAHYFGEQVFNMYKDWYDKAPLTFKLIMRVHYGSNYENAFWNGSSMTFGDGRNYFYPLVSMDVVGHEVSHGYTEQNSNLEYMGQSGGINESFSDMAGKASEYYTFGDNSWGIGDDITKDDEPLRHMDEPAKDGISIGDARDYNDWLDVHYSSGVFNKAFYLLATTSGWNTKKAFDVFVHANTFYWMPDTNYVDGALGAVYSAEDLGYNMDVVIDAFKQVGIQCTEETCEIMPKDTSKDDDSESEGSDDENIKL